MTSHDHRAVAVVTGGGSGIGRATTLRLVEAGYQVVVADQNAAACDDLVAMTDGRVTALRADVRREDDVRAVVDAAVDRHSGLDVMVNNAGVGGAFGPVTDIDVADWDFTFEVLVRGVFLGIKHAAAVMGENAAIVNVASAAAYSGSFGPMGYSAAKAAVVSMTRSAAVELAPRSIRVNAVCPGAVRTPLMEAGRGDELDRMLPPGQPIPRWGRPEDIATVIEFLAGPASGFVTGESILADGGLVAAGPGPDFLSRLGTDPRSRGLAGVNRGSTGERSEVRRRSASRPG